MRMGKMLVAMVAVVMLPALALGANVRPRDDMSSGASWTVLSTSADTAATFGYNYSADGIPEAPNSGLGDLPTTGLKMEANIANGAVAGVLALPNGANYSGQYTVQFDMWINANGPFPGGGGGSTEYLGGGVGHDGSTADRNGALLLIDGEGGSSRDWRLYKNTGEQFVASGQYAVDTNNNSGTDLSNHIPAGKTPPLLQQTAHAQQTGSLAAGTGGFEWMTMTINADSVAGTATFIVTSANGPITIGTLDTTVGSPVSTAGAAAVYYFDLFSSLSDNPALSFGLVDNFVVTPEPTSLALLGLGGLFMLRRRRKA